MYYGVIIDGVNTLDRYGLILASDVKDTPPTQRRETVQVAGMDGEIDLSYVLTGGPVFNTRELEFTLCAGVSETAFMQLYREFKTAYHGKTVKAIMPWDTTRYYTGVVKVGEKSDFASNKFTVTMTCQPYLHYVSDDSEAGL